MSHLQKALQIWLRADHTQAEFAKITGIEQSLCSRIFAGSRGFTLNQRKAIFRSFQEFDPQQGLIFLKADLEDQTPPDARQYLPLTINLPAKLAGKAPKKTNRVEEARLQLISELESSDPSAVSIALALHEWRNRS
ncbi:MAG: hypothetical protein ABIT76_01390 [Chthoniobacterales bacterium]